MAKQFLDNHRNFCNFLYRITNRWAKGKGLNLLTLFFFFCRGSYCWCSNPCETSILAKKKYVCLHKICTHEQKKKKMKQKFHICVFIFSHFVDPPSSRRQSANVLVHFDKVAAIHMSLFNRSFVLSFDSFAHNYDRTQIEPVPIFKLIIKIIYILWIPSEIFEKWWKMVLKMISAVWRSK